LFNCFNSGDTNILDLASQPVPIDTISGANAVASIEVLGLGLVVGEEKAFSIIDSSHF
jgi:hypothetical protein